MIEHWKNLSLENIVGEIGGSIVEERWKEIIGFDNRYMISTFGRVKSKEYYQWNGMANMHRIEFIKQQRINENGYLTVAFSIKNKQNAMKVHRLVAMAFIPNPKNKPEINHKKGIRIDNRISEIEWATRSENICHAFNKLGRKGGGTGIRNELHYKSIPIVQLTLGGEYVTHFESSAEIQRSLRLCQSNIISVCKGKRNKVGNFKWMYKSDYDSMIQRGI